MFPTSNGMKRILYIFLFTLLGAIIGFVVHSAIVIFVLTLLVSDFGLWGFGLTWENWVGVHHLGLVLLIIYFSYIGFMQGRVWWQVVYVERKEKNDSTKVIHKK